MPTVTIDGISVKVAKEKTILDAAKKAGIWIPALCYNETIPDMGSCRLCMVELDRGGWSQMVTACNYPVRQDITVRTASEKAVRIRKGVMQLLLARSPESDELKELAAMMGVNDTPYPTVTESQRNCILCGMCIRVCDEIIGCSAIGFAGRGVDRQVTTPFRLASEDCIVCGACAAICPMGTIRIRVHEDTGEAEISPFKSKAKLLQCEGCGKRMVTQPVANHVHKKINMDWEEFKKRARLCPECRRKRAAESMAFVDAKRRD